jgi:hypothetical protein
MRNLLIFIVGSAIAGVAGYKYGYSRSKKFYEGLADAEVASVKETIVSHYEKKIANLEKKPADSQSEPKMPKKVERPKNNTAIDEPQKGIDYGKQYRTETTGERIPGTPGNEVKHLKKEELDTTKPYVITPEEFHDSEFECVTLYYCKDKVLTDDDFNQINNIGIVGGYPILDRMGEYDADCLYVRNEKLGTDYEILLEERTYSKIKPLGVN